MLAVLILSLAVAAEPEQIDDNKALVCLTLTKVRLTDSEEEVQKFLTSSELPREDINNKMLTNMLLHCYQHVSNETVMAVSAEMDTFQLTNELRALVPLPTAPFETAEELAVTGEEKVWFSQIVQRAQYIQQVMEYVAMQEKWYSGPTGLMYMLGVFVLFGVGMLKLFRGLAPNSKKGKKTK